MSSGSSKNRHLLFDGILIVSLLLLAGILYFLFSANGEAGAWAVVRVDGEETARYPLAIDGTFPLNGGTNILVIDSGDAYLSDADCPDKLCVRQGRVHYTGQVITCLPNRLTVTIEGGESNGVDLIVG